MTSTSTPSLRTALTAATAGIGIVGLVAGCGGGSDGTTTTTAAPSTTEATTTTAASGGASGGSTSGTLPPAPSGSIEVQTSSANGVVYQRWSNSGGSTPQQIVAEYQTALQADGYTVTDTGGGDDVSTGAVLEVDDVVVPAGGGTQIVFEGQSGDVADGSTITHTASWAGDATGAAAAPLVVVRADVDGDNVFDGDDLCPDDAGVAQHRPARRRAPGPVQHSLFGGRSHSWHRGAAGRRGQGSAPGPLSPPVAAPPPPPPSKSTATSP